MMLSVPSQLFPELLQPVGAARSGADDGDEAQEDDGQDRQGQRQEVQGHRTGSRERRCRVDGDRTRAR